MKCCHTTNFLLMTEIEHYMEHRQVTFINVLHTAHVLKANVTPPKILKITNTCSPSKSFPSRLIIHIFRDIYK